ncbi:MAG: hypothetical protein H0W34_14900 [Pyrinomonadaceae bacterium]|nr:hypothetical protein [Pyrinomonadaceae bacterium]
MDALTADRSANNAMNGEPKAMENRVDACRRLHHGTVKTAFLTGLVGAIIACALLLIIKVANNPPNQMTWGVVVLFPLFVFWIVCAGMLWNFGRAMKRSRALDEVNRQSLVSVAEHS